MAKTESTAVNELIGLVQGQPLRLDEPGDNLFDIAPLPRTRAPQSTAQHDLPATHAADPRVRMSTAPAARGTTIPPLPKRASSGTLSPPMRPSLPPPVRRPSSPSFRAATGTLPPPTAPVAAPFELAPPPVLAIKPSELVLDPDSTWVGTLPSSRSEYKALARRLAIPAAACIAAGIGLGVLLTSAKGKTAARVPTSTIAPRPAQLAPTAPATETVLHPTPRSLESQSAGTASAGGVMPEPPTPHEQAATVAAVAEGNRAAGLTSDAPAAALANVAEIQTPRGVVKLVDVRIDTDPQGASITLVDRGKQFPLGSTPLSTALDASRQYDVIVEATGHPSQMFHVDPATTTRLDVALGRKQRAAVAPSTPNEYPTPPATDRSDDDAKATPAKPVRDDKPAKPATSDKAGKATPDKAPAPTRQRAGHSFIDDALENPSAAIAAAGTLMVSSKPPCELVIDGEATGLTTPQRSIELPAGKHSITFVNKDAGIEKTVTVTIKAGKPTKLIQDLLGDVLP